MINCAEGQFTTWDMATEDFACMDECGAGHYLDGQFCFECPSTNCSTNV